MKKRLISVLLLSISAFTTSVVAAPKDELSVRLSKTDGFSASFSQVVFSPDNEIVMEGEGTVEIARPSLFRWTTSFPDESILVSDGESLWYYSPFLEQVSIYWQAQATAQTPFVLLTRNEETDWDNYLVTQQGDMFTLTPTEIGTNQGQFEVDIDTTGMIKGFNVIEQDGQKGQFTFNNYNNNTPDKSLFTFTVPEGVEIDDQRN